jgi:hypothetical protein
MNPKFQDLAFDAVIPSAMLFNKNIEPSAIKLYAFVRGLSRLEGYCYATNAYLSECMDCDDRHIRRLLKTLQKEGFVKIRTNKDGLHSQRHIYVGVDFKNSFREDKNVPPPGQKCPPPRTKMSTNKGYRIEDIEKKEREGATPPPSAPPPPVFFQIHKRVQMPSKKYDALVQEHGVDKILEMMERLDEYADLNPKRFRQYACHAAVIRKWIREDKMISKSPFLKSNTPKTAPVAPGSDDLHNQGIHKAWMSECKRRCWEKIRGIGICFSNVDYVEFPLRDGKCLNIYYKDFKFKELIISQLLKMGVHVD